MDAALFYIFAAMTLTGGILTVTLRSPIHCAISLILSLLGIAGLFLLQTAEFLFAAQILLYIGGVMVLFLFVIMLIHLDEAAKLRKYSRQWPVALVALLCVVIEVLVFLNAGIVNLPTGPSARIHPPGNTESIADSLFYVFPLPFEAASILLLIAIVGAVWMAQRKEVAE